jgi:hypothetical protein
MDFDSDINLNVLFLYFQQQRDLALLEFMWILDMEYPEILG